MGTLISIPPDSESPGESRGAHTSLRKAGSTPTMPVQQFIRVPRRVGLKGSLDEGVPQHIPALKPLERVWGPSRTDPAPGV